MNYQIVRRGAHSCRFLQAYNCDSSYVWGIRRDALQFDATAARRIARRIGADIIPAAHNFKFAVYVNGTDVKVKLAPGQSIGWAQHHRTDEGYHQESFRVELSADGKTLSRGWGSRSADCDGRYADAGEDFHATQSGEVCNVETFNGLEFRYPKFEGLESSHRDYSAEAMGY